MKERITISIDKDLLKQIDELRGIASRSAYIESLLRKALPKREIAVEVSKS